MHKRILVCFFMPHSVEVLREHKPPPIRRIRISDFGLPDPKRDPDRHQNCMTWSLSHALPLQKISSKSVHKFASNLTDKQTDRQTDRTENITSFFGGGNDFITLYMLPLIPLHFLCTHFLQLVHCIELLPTPLPVTPHGHLTPSALPSAIPH